MSETDARQDFDGNPTIGLLVWVCKFQRQVAPGRELPAQDKGVANVRLGLCETARATVSSTHKIKGEGNLGVLGWSLVTTTGFVFQAGASFSHFSLRLKRHGPCLSLQSGWCHTFKRTRESWWSATDGRQPETW